MKTADDYVHPLSGATFLGAVVEATFDDWLRYVFDHEESAEHWSYRKDQHRSWSLPDEVTIEFIARTYEDPGAWMQKYSLKQIADGLAFTWNPFYGNVGYAVQNEKVPWPMRHRAIKALVPLYNECFQKYCKPVLSLS